MKFKHIILPVLGIFLCSTSCSSDDDAAVITPANIVQTSISGFGVAIDENPTVGQSLGTIQTNATSTLTYSITAQNPTGAFSIDTGTGELTVLDATLFDFEVNPTITATIEATGVENAATVTINLNNINEIGDYNHGGVVFWIDPTDNTKGLVCAVADQTTGIQWYNGSNGNSGATGSVIGTGATNTTAIVNYQGTGSYAAQLCNDLALNGFNDWFLPSIDEIELMYNNKNVINITALVNAGASFTDTGSQESLYWSSTQVTTSSAKVIRFTDGYIGNGYKGVSSCNVRAVRAF